MSETKPQRNKRRRAGQPGRPGRPEAGESEFIRAGLEIAREILALSHVLENIGRARRRPALGETSQTAAERFFRERVRQIRTPTELRKAFRDAELATLQSRLTTELAGAIDGLLDAFGDRARRRSLKSKLSRLEPVVSETIGQVGFDGKKIGAKKARNIVAMMAGLANESVVRNIAKSGPAGWGMGIETVDPRLLKRGV